MPLTKESNPEWWEREFIRNLREGRDRLPPWAPMRWIAFTSLIRKHRRTLGMLTMEGDRDA